MKKLIALLLCCLLLTGCGTASPTPTETEPDVTQNTTVAPQESEPTTEATEEPTEPELVTFLVYTANENADGFVSTEVSGEQLSVLEALQNAGVLAEDVVVNSTALEGTALTVDMNDAFRNQIMSQGSTGERLLMGCVVNTFLSAYEAETVIITVEGEILESGHVIYDFPMEFFK